MRAAYACPLSPLCCAPSCSIFLLPFSAEGLLRALKRGERERSTDHLPDAEIEASSNFVCHERAEVVADDHMPRRTQRFLQLHFDELGALLPVEEVGSGRKRKMKKTKKRKKDGRKEKERRKVGEERRRIKNASGERAEKNGAIEQ